MAVIDGKWLSKEGLTYFWSKIKAIFTKQTETNVIANLGAKNLFNISAKDKTLDTVGFTVNGNGTIAVVTTATTTTASNAYVIGTFTPEKTGQYTVSMGLSSAATGGSAPSTTFCVQLRQGTSSSGTLIARIGSDPTTVTLTAGETYALRFYFLSGQTINEICKPMIRPAEITDDTFQPYAKTNRELTTETNVIANLGAKNLFNITAQNAIDYKTTHNISDNTVTIAGSAGFSRYVVPVSLKAGSYIFTANVDSISTSGRVQFNTASDGTGTNVTSQIDFSQAGNISREFTINQDTAFFVMIYSSTSSTDTSSSLVISQCMIRRAEITDDTFESYAPTNRELYETRFASKTVLPDNIDLNNIKTGGIYNGVNSTGNSAMHMPVVTGSFNFVLTVIEANEFIIQIFKQLNSAGDPNLYIRRFYIYNSDWDAWYRLTGTHDDGGGYGAGTLIPDNADLNSYTTIGKYYGGNSAGNTVSHLPVENGAFTFSLEVRQATPSMTYQYLRVCRTADDPYIYVRRKYISWGSWYCFTGSTEH